MKRFGFSASESPRAKAQTECFADGGVSVVEGETVTAKVVGGGRRGGGIRVVAIYYEMGTQGAGGVNRKEVGGDLASQIKTERGIVVDSEHQ